MLRNANMVIVVMFINDYCAQSQTVQKQLLTYHQYCVLIDNKYAKYADADWLSIQTVHKYIYLPKNKHFGYGNSYLLQQ